jgi:O-antigen/teichoic acid export membrane protein
MKRWFRDTHFRSLLRNSSYLGVSQAVAAVAGLATAAFAGRGLGVALFGMLILIHSYVTALSSLSKFETWQLIVRYGGPALASDAPEDFRTSTGFAFALDVLSGVGGMILAAVLLPFIGSWFGIAERYLWLALLYCTLLPTMAAATPLGVLRALNRFDLIAWQGSSYQIARAILAGLAWAVGAPFEAYLAIWYATDLGGDLFLWFLAWRELRRRGLLEGIRPTLRPGSLPGAWRFAIQVNVTGSLGAAWGSVSRLLVGALLGPAGAGLYRVASSLADAAQKPADLLGKAFYPEVVRMDLATGKPWTLMLRGSAVAGAIGLAFALLLLVAGRPIISLLFGAEFLGAYAPLLVLMLVPLLGIVSFPLPAMLYALDRPGAPLKARLIGTIVYLALVAPLAARFGVVGAAAAFAIGYAAIVLVLIWHVYGAYRRVRQPRTA